MMEYAFPTLDRVRNIEYGNVIIDNRHNRHWYYAYVQPITGIRLSQNPRASEVHHSNQSKNIVFHYVKIKAPAVGIFNLRYT